MGMLFLYIQFFSHYFFMHDTWCMMHDIWCMMHDAWCKFLDAGSVLHDAWYIMYNACYKGHDIRCMKYVKWLVRKLISVNAIINLYIRLLKYVTIYLSKIKFFFYFLFMLLIFEKSILGFLVETVLFISGWHAGYIWQ